MVRFDPFAYETHEDPYPVYRRLRDEAPAYFDETRGFWAISRDADVRRALNDWMTFSSADGITLDRRDRAIEPMLLEMDPPRHTQLRALVSRALTPARVAAQAESVRALARRLIDGFAAGGECDLIGDFAAPLPMAVIGDMLGAAPSDRDQLRSWSDALVHRDEGDPELTEEGRASGMELVVYFDRLVKERRRAAPGDDLVGALLAAEDGGAALNHAEIVGFCFLLIIAGNETTTKLIGNAISWLDVNPEQRAKLLADPTLVPGAVEEVLRYDGSTQALARTLTQDTDLHGRTLREGEKVLLLFGSANRDERRWDDPDTFDILRNPAGHLAFGHGIHHCLGAALARVETRVALEELLPTLGEYHVERAGAARVHSGNVRGFSRLPLAFPVV